MRAPVVCFSEAENGLSSSGSFPCALPGSTVSGAMLSGPLAAGAAYYADENDLAQFLQTVPPHASEVCSMSRARCGSTMTHGQKSTCHEFGAMGYGTYAGEVSGTVQVSCGRHMAALGGWVVDLQKGER